MRLLAWLHPVFAVLVAPALANTEKVIFIAPAAHALPGATPGLDALRLATITPAQSVLRTALSVAFPTQDHPHGLDSWYLLGHLGEGQRFEVRVCWPAVQPTQFWLDVYELPHVFDTPELIQSLAAFSEQQQQSRASAAAQHQQAASRPSTAILLLRAQAAADFFSTNQTLMIDPPLVDVDFILDPYLGNVFPASLVPTAIYIGFLAIIAWFVSGWIWSYLATPARAKVHAD